MRCNSALYRFSYGFLDEVVLDTVVLKAISLDTAFQLIH